MQPLKNIGFCKIFMRFFFFQYKNPIKILKPISEKKKHLSKNIKIIKI